MRRVLPALFLASLCGLAALPASAQTVVNPKTVEFDPSADHFALTADNQPLVQRYQLQIFAVGAAQPTSTADLGKPAPGTDGKIHVDFSVLLAGWPLGDGSYLARVAAIGPTGSGTSDPSNTFAFQSQSQVCTFVLGSASQSVPAGGATGSVSVTAGSGCAWTASADAGWVTLGATSGTGTGSVGFVVAENVDASIRIATLTIGGQSFTVTQSAPALCSYALSAQAQSFGQGGGNGSVTVSCGGNCGWAASTPASWITLGTTKGTGTGQASYSVAKNGTTAQRSATLSIAGVAYTVTQAAASRPQPPKKVRVATVVE